MFSDLTLFDIVVRAICLLTTIPIHECAHAYVADKLGDPTAKHMGRLTLNPARHFDLMGSISMILFGIGWARPVPINRMNFDDRKKGMALSAARGPISNVIIAFWALIMAKVTMYLEYIIGGNAVFSTLYTIFVTMCFINISLSIFNLLPFPPFDGSRIFNYFLPDKFYFKVMEYEKYIFIAVFALLWRGILDAPLSAMSHFLFKVLNTLTRFVDKLFYLII